MPVPGVAANSLVAVGWRVPAGSTYGYETVGATPTVQVERASHCGAGGAEKIVVAALGRACALERNVVDVAEMLHPETDPAAPTWNACEAETVPEFDPGASDEKLTSEGELRNPTGPGKIVTDAVTACAVPTANTKVARNPTVSPRAARRPRAV